MPRFDGRRRASTLASLGSRAATRPAPVAAPRPVRARPSSAGRSEPLWAVLDDERAARRPHVRPGPEPSKAAGWSRTSISSRPSWPAGAWCSGRTPGCPTSGSARTACPASPSPSTSPTRAWPASSRRRCWRSRAAPPEWCLRILRHEAGHAIENAYRLRAAPAPPGPVRPHLRALSEVLPAAPLQQELRHPPRRLVRAEPSGRGLRGDLRGLARPRLRLAPSATRAGRRCASSSTSTRSCASWPAVPQTVQTRRTVDPAVPDPQDAARALSREAAALRARPPQGLRRGPAAAVLRRPPATRTGPPRPPSSPATAGAPAAGGALDGGLPVHDRPASSRASSCAAASSACGCRARRKRRAWSSP